MLLLIDFEKAFDSVSWSFIKKTLSFFRFGPDIKKWIEIYYKNIKSGVVVNAHVSTWFQIQRGCRQGDFLSHYLYLLCAEILAIRIRQSCGITGIKKSQVIDTGRCTICKTEKESIRHLLWDCTYTETFWKHVLEWITSQRIHLMYVLSILPSKWLFLA